MKWFLIIAISLILVTVCIVYFRYESRPVYVPVARTAPAAVHRKTAHMPPPKPGPQSPVDISGPLKDRDLVKWVLPEYPDWAQERGITGNLRMKIWVTPAGLVKSFMEPQQLSADPRLDEKAVDALRQWEFAEKPNSFGDQWGVVTIRFSLLAEEAGDTEASLHGFSLRNPTASGAWRCVKEWVGKEFRYYCRYIRPKPANLD